MRVLVNICLFLFGGFTVMIAQSKVLNFTEAWVWEYIDSTSLKQEMVLYREPKTGSWLFTSEAFGSTCEMCNWLLFMPNGNCYISYFDPALNGIEKIIVLSYETPIIKRFHLIGNQPDYQNILVKNLLVFQNLLESPIVSII